MNISQLGKILKATNRLNGINEFNASLPVKIEVKKELNPIRYLLKLGNKELETKSYKKLQVGAKYLGEVLQTGKNINIKNLKKMPQIFEDIPKDAKTFLPNDKEYKKEVLKHLANAQTKEEFIFFSNLLLATQKDIKHIFINENGKKSIHQIKKEKNRLKFYSFFSNLGGIEGELFYNDIFYLNLMVEFQSSLYLIEKYLNELKNFRVSIKLDKTTPLFEKSGDNILNLQV